MSMKKKLGSKLSEGVRQVKSQREPAPVAHPKTAPVATSAAQSKPAHVVTKPTTARVTTQTETRLKKPHRRRVWPD